MSQPNIRSIERRSARRLQSKKSKNSQALIQNKNDDRTEENDPAMAGKEFEDNNQSVEEFALSKSEEEKEAINQIENIPDNTQVISGKHPKTKDVEQSTKPEKKEYKKKQMKQGVTDREWLGSKEHKDKWTALDAKRGMCNDCKKVFSSRQVSLRVS